jgi:hypothetical protein
MAKGKLIVGVICAVAIGLSGCSREQSDWEKARTGNNADSYELFVKKYPSGSFTPQAQARLKELYEERDWQKARDADTPDAYQSFSKQYPEGKWAEEARIRVENFNLAQTPAGAPAENPEGVAKPGALAKPGNVAKEAAQPKSEAAAPKTAASKSAAAGGSYGVQLGAYTSGTKTADKHWAALAKKYPSILHDLTPKVRKTKTAKGNLYRLQVTGLSRANAASICKGLKAKGPSCVVLQPAHQKHAAKKNPQK